MIEKAQPTPTLEMSGSMMEVNTYSGERVVKETCKLRGSEISFRLGKQDYLQLRDRIVSD